MASQTTNLNLKKPALDDDALVTDINGNMDLIDTFAGTTNTAVAGKVDKTSRVMIDRNESGSLADCNAVTETGMYRVINTTANKPSNIPYGTLIYFRTNDYYAQLLISITGLMAVRGQGASGGWQPWKEITNYGTTTEIGNVASPTSTSDTKQVTLSASPSTFRYIMIGNFYSNTGNVCYASTILPYSVFSKAVGNLSAHRLGAYNGASLKFWLGSNNVLNFTLNESTQMPGGYVIVYGIN